jgi:pSer/pThr/pTyr-binding forkhead associated (FHA) protein/S1-C subfamily serine protease
MPFLRLRDLNTDRQLEFEASEVRIGRDPGCELPEAGPGSEVVSGSHARLRERGGSWTIEDEGSRNGTFVDEKRLVPNTPAQLAAGSVIGLGARGPRYRVEAVAKRSAAPTLAEGPGVGISADDTLPLESADAVPASRGQPSPPPAPPQVIRVVLMETKSGEQFQAGGGRIRVGRGKECELRPVGQDDTAVSRVHCEIVLKPDGKVVVRDAQSRNGTYLGGTRISGERELGRGDRLRLGSSGPELVVAHLSRPGEPQSDEPSAKPAPPRRRESLAAKVAARFGEARRSFGGKGATVFLNEMFAESTRKTAKRVRWAVWSFVVLLGIAVAAMYYYSEWRVQQATEQITQQQREAIARQQAIADSMQQAASAERDRLSEALEEARAGSAPASVVDSLRVALGAAEARTEALATALARAESSLAEQLAAGDSVNRAAQAELARLQTELNRASASGTSDALLDSLRAAVQSAEERATQIASQVRAVEGVNLAAVAQANQGAVGLVAVFIGNEIYDGSGFAVTASGYFVTNRHVVMHQNRRPDSVYVTMADDEMMMPADVVQVASPSGPDLAVLKIRGFDGPYLQQVDWSGSAARQGEPAALIGFPAGMGNAYDASTGTVRTSMSAGIFSKVTADVINFDGFTVGGSSGSPVFNATGEVVGVHRAGLREAVGMGFAVPIPQLVALLPAEARRELGL